MREHTVDLQCEYRAINIELSINWEFFLNSNSVPEFELNLNWGSKQVLGS